MVLIRGTSALTSEVIAKLLKQVQTNMVLSKRHISREIDAYLFQEYRIKTKSYYLLIFIKLSFFRRCRKFGNCEE